MILTRKVNLVFIFLVITNNFCVKEDKTVSPLDTYQTNTETYSKEITKQKSIRDKNKSQLQRTNTKRKSKDNKEKDKKNKLISGQKSESNTNSDFTKSDIIYKTNSANNYDMRFKGGNDSIPEINHYNSDNMMENAQQRMDAFGNLINKKSKKYRVSFIDRLKKGKLEDVVEIQKFNEEDYESDEPEEKMIQKKNSIKDNKNIKKKSSSIEVKTNTSGGGDCSCACTIF